MRYVKVEYNNKDIGMIVQENNTVKAVPKKEKDLKILESLIKPYRALSGGLSGENYYDAIVDVKPESDQWLNELHRNVPPEFFVSLPMKSGEENSSIKQ